MPSVSKQQQKFFGLVRALQKGDVSPSSVTKKARDAAKDMKKSDVKKYAATKHKGLPRKVRGETKVRELIKKMVREILDEQKMKQLAVIRSSQPQSPYTIFQDGNGFVMKGGRGFSLSFKDENTISKNTKSLKDYLNRVLGYWSYQKGKIKGINEGKLKEGFADNFIKTVDKHNQKIVNNALALAKQQAPKDIDKSSEKTPKLIAIKTINRMKELRNKTKSPALKKTFQKTIDKLEKDYKKIKEGKLTEQITSFNRIQDRLVDLGFGDMKISWKGTKKKIKDFKPGKRLDNITLEKTHNTLLKKNLIRYDGNSYNVTVNGQKNFKSTLQLEGKLTEDYKNSEWEVYLRDEKGNEKIVKKAKSKRAATILYNRIVKSDDYYEVGMRAIKEGKLTENRKQIAQTILQQLGGNKFIAMTGAKNLGFDSKGSKTTLSFKIGRNAKSINYVKVDYISGKDLYDMSFFRLRAGQLKLIKKVSSIYGDQLQKFFTKNTGLYTRL